MKRLLSLALVFLLLLTTVSCSLVLDTVPSVPDSGTSSVTESITSSTPESTAPPASAPNSKAPESSTAPPSSIAESKVESKAESKPESIAISKPESKPTSSAASSQESTPAIDPEGYYYDVENVVLYLETYGELPLNFITKNMARDLGWEGGSVERYMEDAAIGGDRFGNREGVLPKKSGRTYTECDIDTHGKNSRGAKRLVFSSDGLYFYTDDHYETFTELWVEDGTVVWDE